MTLPAKSSAVTFPNRNTPVPELTNVVVVPDANVFPPGLESVEVPVFVMLFAVPLNTVASRNTAGADAVKFPFQVEVGPTINTPAPVNVMF